MPRNFGPLLCLLCFAAISLACNCKWFETEALLQQLYDQSDEVFVGQAFQAVSAPEPGMNKRFLGYDVLLRITHWKKGRGRRDTVLVLQADGNCNRMFVAGDTVYVFARTIHRIQPLPRQDNEHHYSYFNQESQVLYKDGGTGTVKRYQKWARRFPAVTTNQCLSFTNRREGVPAFFRAKKDE